MMTVGAVILNAGYRVTARQRHVALESGHPAPARLRHLVLWMLVACSPNILDLVVFCQKQTFRRSQFKRFISSCFVHLRKPDAEIFRLALDIAQVSAERVPSVEDTPMFVRIAESLGLRSILHTDYGTTRATLASFGLIGDSS